MSARQACLRLCACALLASGCALAGLSEEMRSIGLPDSIYWTLSDDASLDRDGDGLKDGHENRLADAWRPHFIFDEGENADQHCSTVSEVVDVPCAVVGGVPVIGDVCEGVVKQTVKKIACKQNVKASSLRDIEPVTIFQVRPIKGDAWPRRIVVKYAFLYRLDGGFRGSNECTDYHYGDTESGHIDLISDDGVLWRLDKLDLWRDGVAFDAIEWTAPRDTFSGQMPQRPSPKIYASAGKHHQYPSGQVCEDYPGFCDDDCGGGVQRVANLTPNGTFDNIGEFQAHPGDAGINAPFVSDLAPLGFPGERVWEVTHSCTCPLATTPKKCFTGGVGTNWEASSPPQKCTTATPVLDLFDASAPPKPPAELGTALTMIVVF